ncbi:MAG: TonB-dependent receptor, partial [Gammaproteobacteria bacterium]
DLSIPLSFPDMNPFDLDRVEVLKGPQGTLFGAGALAGAIRFITHKPDFGVWEGKLTETFLKTRDGGGLSPTTAGAINIPLFGDSLAIRAVGVLRRDRGLYDMSAHDSNGNSLRDDPDADKLKQTSARVLASWNPPIDDLKLSGFYFGQHTRSNDFGFANNPETPSRDDVPFASPREHDFGGGNLLVTYDLGWAQLESTTNRMTKRNYILNHQEFLFGLQNQNQIQFYTILGNFVNGYTEELRLTSPEGGDASAWEWLLGAAYMKYKSFLWDVTNSTPASTPVPRHPDDLSEQQRQSAVIYAELHSDTAETALFGEVTRRFGEHLELTLGGRGYRTQQVSDTLIQGLEEQAFFPGTTRFDQSFNQAVNGFNPKISLRYLHSRNVQLYVLAAKGFQFGGVQINPPAPGFEQSANAAGLNFGPYHSSDLWNYESGIRTEWLDRRLRLDLALFYLDWKDLQQTIAVALLNSPQKFGVIVNIGRAHSEGIEAALEIIPFTGAKWTSSAGWINAVTDVLVPTASGDIPAGSQLPGAPKFQWSNMVSYVHSLPYFNAWEFGPVLTHAHVGTSPDNIIPSGAVGGYDTLDARLSLVKTDSRFLPELSLGVNNLTDVRGVTHHVATAASASTPPEEVHFIQPRTTVLSVSMKF